MTISEFVTILDSLGYDLAKDWFPEDYQVSFPYLIYSTTETNNIYADDKVFCKVTQIQVSVFSKDKADTTAMAALESLLDSNDIPWQFQGEYDHNEYDYEALYTVTIV